MNFLSLAVRTKRTVKETGIVALPLSAKEDYYLEERSKSVLSEPSLYSQVFFPYFSRDF